MARLDGVSAGSILAGTIIGYAGIKGYSIPATVQNLVTGKSPANQAQVTPVSGGAVQVVSVSGITGQGATGSDSAIATTAVSYIGKLGYSWDGSLASGKPDCSGYVNGVIGGDLKLAIPGYPAGTFSKTLHGPSSFIWAAWNGCTTIGHDPAQAMPGDLAIFMNPVGHIGIATGGGKMVSDLDPQQGCRETPIKGTATGVLIIRRLKG